RRVRRRTFPKFSRGDVARRRAVERQGGGRAIHQGARAAGPERPADRDRVRRRASESRGSRGLLAGLDSEIGGIAGRGGDHNMKALLVILITLSCVVALHRPLRSQTPKTPRAMAVTIDDLPYVNTAYPVWLPNAKRVTTGILRELRAHNVPAVGFVNEDKVSAGGEINVRTPVLRQWADAGIILGNHTYSHPDF